MKENYQIYLPYQFYPRVQSVGGDAQLAHKKMKTLFLSNMSKSRRLTSTFFPITAIPILESCHSSPSQSFLIHSRRNRCRNFHSHPYMYFSAIHITAIPLTFHPGHCHSYHCQILTTVHMLLSKHGKHKTHKNDTSS